MDLQLRCSPPTVLLLLCLATSCGKDVRAVHAAETPRLHTLELVAAPPRPAAPAIELVERLSPGPKFRFHAKVGAAELVAVPVSSSDTPAQALEISGPKGIEVHFPVDQTGDAFNAVTIEIQYDEEREFTLDFESSGRRVQRMRGSAMSKMQRGAVAGSKQLLHFQMPALYRKPAEVSRLILRAGTKTKALRLHAIDFLKSPLELHLPSPDREPGLILVGTEERYGVGMSPQYGIRSQWLVAPQSVLRFSYAAPGAGPKGLPAAEADTALVLSIRGQNASKLTRRFTPTGPNRFRWFDVRVPLDEFEGQQIDIRWQVDATTEDPWALAEASVLQGAGRPKKVLLITSDTHRADHLGLAKDPANVRTPQLDALAERGILFEDCFASTNITNPSHIALMTATHPRDIGVFSNNEPISTLAPTLAEAFQEAGFATMAALSIKHLGNRMSGLGQGFDRVSCPRFGSKRDGSEAIADILDWAQENSDLPLFLWVHMYDAHTPYVPPDHLLESYYSESPETAFDPSAPDPEGVPSHVYDRLYPGLKDLEYPKALYAGEVTHVDYRLTELFDHPSLLHAVIAFTSDHGESLGQHGIYYAHADLYPDSLRVPLILSYPGSAQGERVATPVRQIDLGRTLLDLGGAWATEFPGTNLVAAAEKAQRESPPRFAMSAGKSMASITRDDWHLILALRTVRGHHRVNERPKHEVSLFHLGRDPEANENLLETEFERAQELRSELLEWLASAEDRGWRGAQITDAATLRALESLGYVSNDPKEEAGRPKVYFDETCSCDWCSRFDG